MKNSPSLFQLAQTINTYSRELGGVFTFGDLWNLAGTKSSDRTAKVIRRLVQEKILHKIRRGLYVTASPDLWILASRLKAKTCISMDSVLARNGLIGTTPKGVSVVYPGNPQTLATPFGKIRFFKIKKNLLFGSKILPNGVTVADNEKAYLDSLYYYMKGARFVIDPQKDVDLWRLDRAQLQKYLKRYKNPKFRRFVEGLING